MPRREITGQFTVEAATPEGAKGWLADELNRKLSPGEDGSPWQAGVGEAPRYQLASIRRVVAASPVPPRREGGRRPILNRAVLRWARGAVANGTAGRGSICRSTPRWACESSQPRPGPDPPSIRPGPAWQLAPILHSPSSSRPTDHPRTVRGTTISATPPDCPTPPRPTRIRGLLARALDQGDTERFWSLAVATQLIEEHLADLHHRAARPLSAPYGWRAWRACRAWEVLRAIVLALLGR